MEREGSPLLSGDKDPEKVYGVTEQGDTAQQPRTSSSSRHTSSKPSTSCGCCFCSSFTIAVTFILIFTLLAGFGALSYTPYPTATTLQGVLQGDTIPIYFSSKSDIPNGPNTYWYKSVSTSVKSGNDLNTNVDFVYVKGNDGCNPGHSKTENFESNNITLSPGDVLAIKDGEYVTISSTIYFDIDIFADDPSTQVELYVIDNKADFDCFIDRSQTNCKHSSMYPLKTTDTNEIKFYPPVSSYYYFVLSTQGEISFTYNYITELSYYNISDYDSDEAHGTCSIEPNEAPINSCEFELANRRGCLIVFSPTPGGGTEPSFVELNVRVVHERFTIPSVACLTFAGAFFVLFVCSLIAYAFILCGRSMRKKSDSL